MNRVRGDEPGQILVLFCFGLVVLMGFLALAVDIGLLWSDRRHMQTAADAAAVAGAVALGEGNSDNMQNAAAGAAALNSFTATPETYSGPNPVTVTINNPPLSGTYKGNSAYVEAIIDQPQTTFFLRALGYATVDVSTRAVSGQISGPACIYAIDPSAADALEESGGATITANCGIIVDSDSTTAAIDLSGGKTKLVGSSIGVVGGVTDTGGSSFSPAPITGIAPLPDPLSYLQPPTLGSCMTGLSESNATSGNGGAIGPGTYCSGIKVSGGNTLNLSSGTYILTGSNGLNVSGGSNIIGSSVTIYNGGTGQINISGGSTTSLTAPTTEPYEGILIYQDKSNTTSATISGGSGTVYQGALYFPKALLNYSGGSTAAAYTIIVADKVNLSGGSAFSVNDNTSSLTDGSPIKSGALYE
jgi:Flp pilus assembly protein TadG